MIAMNMIKVNAKWTFFRIITRFSLGYFRSNSRKSIQKEVVRAVSVESALEYAAAVIPRTNTMPAKAEKCCVTNIGNSSSVLVGSEIPFVSV